MDGGRGRGRTPPLKPREGTGARTAPIPGPFIGAHCSIAGGLHNAILAAAELKARAVQIFAKNSNQWRGKEMLQSDVEDWNAAIEKYPVFPIVHDSYLINLASPDPALLEKSRVAFLDEIRRCERLGITRLVFHPGAHIDSGEDAGLRRIAKSLDWACAESPRSNVMLVLETTAGHGSVLGSRFEHLARIIESARRPERLGVCIDTCHLLAAGYDFRSPAGYRAVFDEFDRIVGCGRIACFHLNDSKRDLGSRADRHEHIGKGFVGREAFRMLMRDSRFAEIPKVIETPKVDDWDKRNLSLLRRLARG
jgi:deoxyribonuclease IV